MKKQIVLIYDESDIIESKGGIGESIRKISRRFPNTKTDITTNQYTKTLNAVIESDHVTVFFEHESFWDYDYDIAEEFYVCNNMTQLSFNTNIDKCVDKINSIIEN